MRRAILSLAALVACTLCQGQISWKWTPVPVDSTWDDVTDPAATLIIEKYKPLLGSLQEIIGYSDREYSSRKPESELSSFAADMMLAVAEYNGAGKVDVAMTNFGGIRNSLPKGAVRVYDIFAIFPFENSVVYIDLKGSDLREMVASMLRRNRIEALSNVRITAAGGKLEKVEVGGEPLDDGRIYRLATSSFLIDGGDGIELRSKALNFVDTGVMIRDAFVDHIRRTYGTERKIELVNDGRVVFEKEGGR